MKKNLTNKKVKLQVEYLNALGMPVVVTKKVTPDKLSEFLDHSTPMVRSEFERKYGA